MEATTGSGAVQDGQRWSANCKAAQMLRRDIDSNQFNLHNYEPKQVWMSRREYQMWPLDEFRTNLSRLVKKELLDRAQRNSTAAMRGVQGFDGVTSTSFRGGFNGMYNAPSYYCF